MERKKNQTMENALQEQSVIEALSFQPLQYLKIIEQWIKECMIANFEPIQLSPWFAWSCFK